MEPERLAAALEYGRKYIANRKRSVYFVQCNEFVKIGIAWNVPSRIEFLQTGCPYKLRLIHCFQTDDAATSERGLHLSYAQYHHQGEWYALPKEVIEEWEQREAAKIAGTINSTLNPTFVSLPAPEIPKQRSQRKKPDSWRNNGYWLRDAKRSSELSETKVSESGGVPPRLPA